METKILGLQFKKILNVKIERHKMKRNLTLSNVEKEIEIPGQYDGLNTFRTHEFGYANNGSSNGLIIRDYAFTLFKRKLMIQKIFADAQSSHS
ncbi:5784_t:CDS:2 [Funneliformis geosporum]|uniref:5784_t:CDS:1 n=1 Tax=Funneliformis geosporum TaxID=1117311 RepID=A0A9W4WWA2_9GLOM|nr:5784_t:CDS:2 [Funneliformis geosporum]